MLHQQTVAGLRDGPEIQRNNSHDGSNSTTTAEFLSVPRIEPTPARRLPRVRKAISHQQLGTIGPCSTVESHELHIRVVERSTDQRKTMPARIRFPRNSEDTLTLIADRTSSNAATATVPHPVTSTATQVACPSPGVLKKIKNYRSHYDKEFPLTFDGYLKLSAVISCLAVSVCASMLWQCAAVLHQRTRFAIASSSVTVVLLLCCYLARFFKFRVVISLKHWQPLEIFLTVMSFVLMVLSNWLCIDKFCYLETRTFMATVAFGCCACFFLAVDFVWLMILWTANLSDLRYSRPIRDFISVAGTSNSATHAPTCQPSSRKLSWQNTAV